MSEANTVAAAKPREVRPFDLGLNIGIGLLLAALLGLAGWFGYSVWVDYQQSQMTNAPMRVVRAIEAQVRKSPNDVVLRVRLGEALGAAGKYPQAIEQFNQALKLDPKHVGAYLDLGTVAMMTKKDEEAQRYFGKVIELTEGADYENVDERRETALYKLGLLHLVNNRYDQAAGYFKGALRIRKDASDTYLNLARALRGMDDIGGAKENLDIALAFDPGFAEAYYLMGELYQQEKDDVKATYYFAKTAELVPDAELPQETLASYGTSAEWLSRAEKSLASGDADGALKNALVAKNLDPKNAEALTFHAALLIERDDIKDALQVYLAALKIAPKNVEAIAGVNKIEQDYPKQALAVYRSMLKEDSDNTDLKKKVAALKK